MVRQSGESRHIQRINTNQNTAGEGFRQSFAFFLCGFFRQRHSLLTSDSLTADRRSGRPGRFDGIRRLCHTADMKYTILETLSDTLAHVKTAEGDYMLETVRFPRDQKDLFDWMMQGKTMPEIEEECLQQVQTLGKELDLLQLAGPESHLVKPLRYEIMKIPGGTGWQAEILKPRLMPLSVLRRYHTLTPREESLLANQLAAALREAKKARLHKNRVLESDVYVAQEHEFLLDLTGLDWPVVPQEECDTLETLVDVVRDPDLRQRLRRQPLFGDVSE